MPKSIRRPRSGSLRRGPTHAEALVHRLPTLTIFAGLALVLLAVLPPSTPSSDSASMLKVGDALVTHLTFAIPCDAPGAIRGRGGLCYSNYYLLMSLIGTPFILAGRTFGGLAGVDQEFAGHAAALALPALATAGAATLTAVLAFRMGATRRMSVILALGTAVGTELLTYSRTYFAEPLVAFLAALAVWGIVADGKHPRRFAYGACALIILAKPQAALLGPALAGLAFIWGERHVAVRLLLAALVGTAIALAYNLLRFSALSNFGGETRDVDASALHPAAVLHSLALLLISPGRGLLWFNPLAVIGLIALVMTRRERTAQAALVAAGAVTVIYLTNSGIGFNWGTRYLVPAIPLLVAGVALVRAPAIRRIAVLAGVLGLIINLPNIAGYYQRFHAERSERGATPSQVHWSLANGQLLGVWGSARRQVVAASHRSVTAFPRDRAQATTVALSAQFNIVALWWWVMPAAGISRYAGLFVFIVLLAAGVALLRLAARMPQRDAPRGVSNVK